MEKKTKLEGDILLTARRNSLREAASSQIQARGKFRGFDVFTWIDAPLDSFLATLNSMPFPIVWVTTSAYFDWVTQQASIEFNNVSMVFILDDEKRNELQGEVVYCDSLQQPLAHPVLIQGRGTLLFSVTGSRGVDTLNEFTFILKAMRTV